GRSARAGAIRASAGSGAALQCAGRWVAERFGSVMNDLVGSWLARNKMRAALLGGVLVVLLVSGRHWLPGTRSDAAARQAGPAAVSVEASEAKRQDVPVSLQGLGNIQAYNTVTVTSRVDGELQKLSFVEGQLVHKGELLAQIDPRPYQAALTQ